MMRQRGYNAESMYFGAHTKPTSWPTDKHRSIRMYSYTIHTYVCLYVGNFSVFCCLLSHFIIVFAISRIFALLISLSFGAREFPLLVFVFVFLTFIDFLLLFTYRFASRPLVKSQQRVIAICTFSWSAVRRYVN